MLRLGFGLCKDWRKRQSNGGVLLNVSSFGFFRLSARPFDGVDGPHKQVAMRGLRIEDFLAHLRRGTFSIMHQAHLEN
jgi:hypothetical protein